MEDEMNFHKEIWADDDGRYYVDVRLTPEFLESVNRYIHESKVPVSCGGTMEEEKLSDPNPWAGIRCIIHEYSSRVCEKGTKGCVIDHRSNINIDQAEHSLRRRKRAPETVGGK